MGKCSWMWSSVILIAKPPLAARSYLYYTNEPYMVGIADGRSSTEMAVITTPGRIELIRDPTA